MSLTEPDDAVTIPAGSITLISGADQRVGPGEAVPTRPIIRVLSNRGRPLRGATVDLMPVGSAGAVAATSVITNDAGEATMPRWEAPFAAGDFYLNISVHQPPGTGTDPVSLRIRATVSDADIALGQQTIGPTGGRFTYTSPLSSLNDLTLTVPSGASKGSVNFKVTSLPAPEVPSNVTVASPPILISDGAVTADSIVRLPIPARPRRGGDHFVAVLGPSNRLIPPGEIRSEADSVTVGLTRSTAPGSSLGAASLLASTQSLLGEGLPLIILEWYLPTTGTIVSGFLLRVANSAFVTRGSYWAFKGYCADSTILSGWPFLRKSRGETSFGTRAAFPSLLTEAEAGTWPFREPLNPSVRLATALQASYGTVAATAGVWKSLLGQSARSLWRHLAIQMFYDQNPTVVELQNATSGHAVLAHKIALDLGRVYVIDPHAPAATAPYIEYDKSTVTFRPFRSGQCASCPGEAYTQFSEATYFLAEEWADLTRIGSEYSTNGRRSQYGGVTGRLWLASNQIITADGDVTTLALQSKDRTLRFVAANLASGSLEWMNFQSGNGTRPSGSMTAVSPTETLRVTLASRENRVGILLRKPQNDGHLYWYDATLLVVNRAAPALTFLVQPVYTSIGIPPGAVRVGLVDEDGVLISEVRPISLELVGAAPGAGLSGGSAPTGIDGSATFTTLAVNQAGTGILLRATSPGLPSVTSSPFDVTAVPVPTLTTVTPANGPVAGGTTISITGTNFPLIIDSIRIGPRRIASIVRVSGTQITGVTPAETPGPTTATLFAPLSGSAACVGCYTYGDGSVVGIGRDAVTNRAISGATLQFGPSSGAFSRQTTLAANGSYTFASINGGIYQVEATANGFVRNTAANPQIVDVAAGDVARADFALPAASSTQPFGALNGRVIATACGMPVTGASVTLDGGAPTHGVLRSIIALNNGTSLFTGVVLRDALGNPLTTSTVRVSAAGFAGQSRSVVRVQNQVLTNVDFHLDVGTGPTTFFSDGFEGASGWTSTGLWNRSTLVGILNHAYPTYVRLVPDDHSGAALPAPRTGAFAYCYGQPPTGNFIGVQQNGDTPFGGGTSIAPNTGSLTSPSITIPQSIPAATPSFDTWFEIESQNPNSSGYDLMESAVRDAALGSTTTIGRLNPFVDPTLLDRGAIPFTSAGFNLAPVWRTVTVNLNPYRGRTVQIIFRFSTVHPLYNGFRGWILENVRITDESASVVGAAPFASRLPRLAATDGRHEANRGESRKADCMLDKPRETDRNRCPQGHRGRSFARRFSRSASTRQTGCGLASRCQLARGLVLRLGAD